LTVAEIINLRMARKARARAESAQKAVENRAKFGRSKAQKAIERTDMERQARTLDGAKREGED
jgi:hypothetical protein